ncbi:Uncharacterised protein [Klebsiella pneumoniae]|uniref:Uncharacterized protein n=1 Tax=Klebsiella pneumoniae TaxID=573 RepID=A0A2X3EE43_KLEPN|nr:Uncharacterised protein [Klebsiella pneumoniae]
MEAPIAILCDYQGGLSAKIGDLGRELVVKNTIWTEYATARDGDYILIGASTDAAPPDEADEIRQIVPVRRYVRATGRRFRTYNGSLIMGVKVRGVSKVSNNINRLIDNIESEKPCGRSTLLCLRLGWSPRCWFLSIPALWLTLSSERLLSRHQTKPGELVILQIMRRTCMRPKVFILEKTPRAL